MRLTLAIASAALLGAACSAGNTDTRTASGTSPATWGAAATNTPASARSVEAGGAASSPTADVSQSTSDNNTGVRTVTAPVAAVRQDSIVFGPAGGNMTLKVDSSTKIFRAGLPVSEGISAIHEGQQVRARFDATQNRANRIELIDSGTGVGQDANGGVPRSQRSAPASDQTPAPGDAKTTVPR